MYPVFSFSHSLSLTLCCYVTPFKSVTLTFLMLLQELQRCCSEINHFRVYKEGKKERKGGGGWWGFDKTFMITRVWRMDTEPLIQRVVCS